MKPGSFVKAKLPGFIIHHAITFSSNEYTYLVHLIFY
jgi:hypothetical protein